MGEFGHQAIIGGGFCIDSWGAGPFLIEAGGKKFRFEDSDRFGPNLCTATGEICEHPFPPEKSPFWRAHKLWVLQGRQTEDDKITCIWREPKPYLLRRKGRQIITVQEGEPEGQDIFVDDLPLNFDRPTTHKGESR